ncbi:MAG: hypothetical protein ACRC42_04525 [Mycoplasma sp.]
MLKVNTDYINKFDKKETLTIMSKFKSKISLLFESEFNLLDVDPEYIIDLNKVPSNNRSITFDNYFENQIFQFTPSINNQLISYVNDYDFTVNSGVMCYAAKFYRDYVYNLNQTSCEFIFYAVWKEFLSEINEKKLITHVENIVSKLNSIANLVNKSLTQLSGKMEVTTIDKLIKRYPLIPRDKLIQYANNTHELLLVFGTNGNNKKKWSFLEDKYFVYGDLTATLYCFNKNSNETLKVLTIYVPPSKIQLQSYIKNNNLNQANYSYVLSTLYEDSNTIGIELHFHQLMMHTLEKYSIHEVIKSPCSLDVNTRFKKNYVL